MNKQRLLIAEDDSIFALFLKNTLTKLGFETTIASNGKEAIDIFRKSSFPIVITDFEMPIVNGGQLIDFLKESEEEPIIFVLTSHMTPSIIIDIMKKGVFDYLTKPPNESELELKLKRAFEIYHIRRLDRIAKSEKYARLEGQFEWIKWKEKHSGTGDFKKLNTNLFESLKSSFSQGTGFGALVSLIKMVATTSEREGNFFKIDASLMELIQANAEMAEKAISTFERIEQIFNHDPGATKVSCDIVYNDLKIVIQSMDEIRQIKRQNI